MNAAKRQVDLDAVDRQATTSVGIDAPRRRPNVAGVEPGRDDARARERAPRRPPRAATPERSSTGTPSAADSSSRITPARSPKSLEVLLGDRRDDGDVRLDDRAQSRDLARLIGPHLDDGDVGRIGNGEQRQRNADEIVQIARRRVHLEHAARARP